MKRMPSAMLLACSFLVILALLTACASLKCHRPEYYQRTGSEQVMESVGVRALSVGSTHARYLSVYPECAQFDTSEGDFMLCIRDIDIKEGRLKSWD